LDCRDFKKTSHIEVADIAKRLQDFGEFSIKKCVRKSENVCSCDLQPKIKSLWEAFYML